MQAPGVTDVSAWGAYLPFYNTVILLSSSVTVHFAHDAIKAQNRNKLIGWLGLTVLLGFVFLVLQVEEYIHAYTELGLTLGSGIRLHVFHSYGVPRISRNPGHLYAANTVIQGV